MLPQGSSAYASATSRVVVRSAARPALPIAVVVLVVAARHDLLISIGQICQIVVEVVVIEDKFPSIPNPLDS